MAKMEASNILSIMILGVLLCILYVYSTNNVSQNSNEGSDFNPNKEREYDTYSKPSADVKQTLELRLNENMERDHANRVPDHVNRDFTNQQKDSDTDPNWEKVFLFLRIANYKFSCNDMYSTQDKQMPYGDDYKNMRAKMEQYILQKGITDIEGHSANYLEQTMSYWRIAKAPFLRTVCETGFNAGHSALMWLSANHLVKLYSFDIGNHNYSYEIANFLRGNFPGRLTLTWGDSKETLPKFRKNNPHIKCDLIIVDGGHSFETCNSDFKEFYQMANKNNIVILDNYPDPRFANFGEVWENAKRRGTISEVFSCSYLPEQDTGFSIGRFIYK